MFSPHSPNDHKTLKKRKKGEPPSPTSKNVEFKLLERKGELGLPKNKMMNRGELRSAKNVKLS